MGVLHSVLCNCSPPPPAPHFHDCSSEVQRVLLPYAAGGGTGQPLHSRTGASGGKGGQGALPWPGGLSQEHLWVPGARVPWAERGESPLPGLQPKPEHPADVGHVLVGGQGKGSLLGLAPFGQRHHAWM